MVDTIHIDEGIPVTRRAQVHFEDGTAIQEADLYSIRASVYEGSSQTPLYNWPLDITDVIFDTLQTASQDAGWTEGGAGYNFKHTFDPLWFPKGGRTYRVEIIFSVAVPTLTVPVEIPDRFNVVTLGRSSG